MRFIGPVGVPSLSHRVKFDGAPGHWTEGVSGLMLPSEYWSSVLVQFADGKVRLYRLPAANSIASECEQIWASVIGVVEASRFRIAIPLSPLFDDIVEKE